MQLPSQKYLTYYDPEFETWYENFRKEMLTAAFISARQDATENKPITEQEYNITFLLKVKSKCQSGLDLNKNRFSLNTDLAHVLLLRKDAEIQFFQLKKNINEMEKKESQLRIEVEKMRHLIKPTISPKFRFIIPIIQGTLEGVSLYSLLSDMGLATMYTISSSMILALVSGLGVHFGAHYVCNGKTEEKRTVRLCFILGAAFLSSVLLGFVRASFLNNIKSIDYTIDAQVGSPTSVNAWLFVGISFLSFWVALTFQKHFWQTNEEKVSQTNYDEKRNEIKELQTQQLALKKQIDSIKANRDEISANFLHKHEMASNNEVMVVSLLDEITNTYQETNANNRSTPCPDFFGNPLKIQLRRYFESTFTYENSNK